MAKFLSKLFFNLMYLRRPPWDTGISPPELTAFMAAHPPGRALDLGCGTGTNAISLAQHGWDVTGVDFAPKAIRAARLKAQKAGVSIDFRVDDVTRLRGIHRPFQLILDIGCFHNLKAQSQSVYIANIKRLLAAEGTFLMYAFLQADPSARGGVSELHLREFERFLRLEQRVDGTERKVRASAWFTFTR